MLLYDMRCREIHSISGSYRFIAAVEHTVPDLNLF